MPNPYYPVLTQEQKRRKQAIRNYKREQAKLEGEYYEFAVICKNRIAKDRIYRANRKIDALMTSACSNLEYSLKDIFTEHDKQDELKYHSEVLSDSVVDFLYR